jgi:hypothetical protein
VTFSWFDVGAIFFTEAFTAMKWSVVPESNIP